MSYSGAGMRAVGIKAFGGADALEVMSVPVPEPGPGEALVKVAFAGINFIDVYMRSGRYARSQTYKTPLPLVLGMEGAGTIVKAGAGVGDLKAGDRVAWCIAPGSYAEHAAVPAMRLVPVPADIPLDMACALQLQGATAHYLTQSAFPVKAGDVALVHSGAGGVGQLMIQILKASGATVIATVGSDDKAAIASRLGADHVIVYTREDFLERVRAITGGKGCNVVYDAVGKDTIANSIRATRRRGLVVNYGGASGLVDAISPLELAEAGSVFFTRPHLADYMQDAAEIRSRMGELFAAFRDGRLKVAVDRVLALDQAREAHRIIEGRGTRGKLLLKVLGG